MTTDSTTTGHLADPPPAAPPTGPVAGDVVVAVGDDDLTGALRYAVAEARARSAGLHLVRVAHLPSTDGAVPTEVWEAAIADGRTLLGIAATVTRDLGPELRVSTHLAERGTIAGTVVEQGTQASVIVVQHRHLGRVRRLVTHSVTRAIAAHADAPVVAVPERWAPRPEQTGGAVVVGVKDLVDAQPLISRSLAEAARRDLTLRIVHAGQRRSREATGIEAIAHDVHAEHPVVQIRVITRDAPAVRLLLNQPTAADLVVVGRRHHTLPGTHVGPVARAVLEDATCPVLLLKVVLAHT